MRFALVVLLLLYGLQLQIFASKLDVNVGFSNTRTDKSKYILRYLNETANPCEDFYAFACGNWEKYHESKTPHTFLKDKIDNDLENIMNEPITMDDKMHEVQIKEFYKSCILAERNGIPQQQYFSDFIKGNGGFPAVPGSNWYMHHYNYNWQDVVAQLRHRYGLDILIGLRIDINYLSINESSIYLEEPSTLIPAELCSAEGVQRVDIRDKEYEPIERHVAEQLKGWLGLSKEESRRLAAEVVTFEYELCEGIQVDTNASLDSPLISYERKTLIDFTRDYRGLIDFNKFVSSSLGKHISTPVFMAAPKYFDNLIKTIAEHNTTTIANYIMYRSLSFLSFPLDDNPQKRPSYCLNVLKRYFPKIVGSMYYKKHASMSAKNDTELLFDNLKESFRQSLYHPWIEERTRRAGLNKLANIRLHFPQYELQRKFDIQMERFQYWKNLVKIMAFKQQYQVERLNANPTIPYNEVEAHDAILRYRKTHARIEIGWAMLQSPYYNEIYPKSIIYATFGQLIAEALASAFDDLSWTTPTVSYWDESTAREFRQRYECFRLQYSNYLHNMPNKFQNYTKLREIVAASGGLNLAFQAYLNWLLYFSPNNDFDILRKETLTDVNYTNTQLFFITFAQMYCYGKKSVTNGEKLNKFETIPWSALQMHTAERYLIDGPLSNNEEFAREFHCTVGSEMNPIDKCKIF